MRARDRQLRDAVRTVRARGAGVIADCNVRGKLVRDRDTGAETLLLRCTGYKPPQQRTIRRWLVAAEWDPDAYPPESWQYDGNTVRIVAKEPPEPEPPTGGEE